MLTMMPLCSHKDLSNFSLTNSASKDSPSNNNDKFIPASDMTLLNLLKYLTDTALLCLSLK